MKAPEPDLSVHHQGVQPGRQLLDRIEATIRGSDATVPVESTIAYRRW